MAEQAFYQVDNRGTGPSVHLMRELARIWGNLDYGVKELHRDDESGNSEVQAFAWDVQRNTRSSRTFINPHARMKGRGAARERVQLVDLTDIYLSNQNVGARAVRECISTILPRWFTEKAQEICRRTLEHGEGEPLQDRIERLVVWFGQMSVSVAQLEARAGKARGAWDAQDVAQFKIAGKSIMAGEARVEDLFPAVAESSSAADEIAAAPAEEKPKRTRRPRGAASKAEENVDAESGEATQVTPQETGVGDGDTNEVDDAGASDKPADPDPCPAADADPGRGGGNEQSQGAESSSGPAPRPDSADQDTATPKPEKNGMRKAVEKRTFTLLGEVRLGEQGTKLSRDDRIDLYRELLGRPEVGSTDDLDNVEVTKIGDQLYQWQQAGVLNDKVHDVLMAADARAIAETEGTQQ
ncbi:MAG: hypothetical protein PGN30_13035 [Mycolicibacterium neoaurum]|uniref:hypothetical protein n=1 Tax=Mycolicibacterium neoaurum TaxID=1795 RepID=UPI002FFBE773